MTVSPPQVVRRHHGHRSYAPGDTSTVHHLVVGEPRHGVTRLGVSLLPRTASVTALPAFSGTADVAIASAALATTRSNAIHLHVNDDLLGPDPVHAAATLAEGRRLAVTLHDVPQPAEGASRFARRSAVYRRLASVADLVLVCSDHERRGLRRIGVTERVEVIDHPIDARPPQLQPLIDRTVGVLGWIHPGKGHVAVLEAMRSAMPGGTLVALGAPSRGQRDLVQALRVRADQLEIELRITGYLDDDTILAEAGRIAVPVCAHRHVSASGSIGTWMAAGRAPVVADGGYTRDLAARCPGAVTIAQDLTTAIAAAAAQPETTMIDDPARIGPTTAEAARRQAELLCTWAGTP